MSDTPAGRPSRAIDGPAAEAVPSVPTHPLRRGIAWALIAKAVALGLLYVLFFSPDHRPAVTPDRLAGVLLAAPTVEAPVHD